MDKGMGHGDLVMSEAAEDHAPATGFSLNESPSHLLHRAQQFAAIQSAAALKEAGITLRQFSVLAAIAETEGVSQSRLVEATGIDRSTLADMVSRMQDAGLIQRVRSETDARAKAVSLTDAGRHALDVAGPAVRSADEKLLEALPKNRRSAFIDILSRLTETGTEDPRRKAETEEAKADKPKKAAAKKDKDKKKKKKKKGK